MEKPLEVTPLEMHLGITPRIQHAVNLSVLTIGISLICLGLAVSIGWVLDVDVLKRVLPGRVSMKINAAIGFALLGGSFVLMANARLKHSNAGIAFGRLCALAVILLGGATGLQDLFAIDLGIDQLLIKEPVEALGISPGRMSPLTALCFVLLGIPLMIQRAKGKAISVAQIFSFLVFLISYAVLLGYIYDSPQPSGNVSINAMAIHTSLAFLLGGIAGLGLFHDHRNIAILLSPSPAGYTTRRFIPVIYFGPMLLGAIQWYFFVEGWLEGPMATAVLLTAFVGITSFISNSLAWAVFQEYALKRESEADARSKSELMAWRERLVSSLVHDLRTPLTVARSVAELFERKPEDAMRRTGHLSKQMIQAIDRTDRLLRNLLDSTAAITGKLPRLDLESVRLCEILGQCVENVEQAYMLQPGRRIQLKCEDIHGHWNRDAVLRIFENLLSNAIKYGEPSRPVEVTTVQLEEKAQIAIQVHNWGRAIPELLQSRIFDIYKREDAVRGAEGWGVGLSVVRTLTEAMQGRVSVRSDSASGTTFTITLPTRPAMSERVA